MTDPRPPTDDNSRERKRERFNTRDWSGPPLIHPDAADPVGDFEGWLDRLVREARDASDGTTDDALLASLEAKATDLESQL